MSRHPLWAALPLLLGRIKSPVHTGAGSKQTELRGPACRLRRRDAHAPAGALLTGLGAGGWSRASGCLDRRQTCQDFVRRKLAGVPGASVPI